MIMKIKELYEAPVVECYEINLERKPLMASEPTPKRGTAGQDDTVVTYDGLL